MNSRGCGVSTKEGEAKPQRQSCLQTLKIMKIPPLRLWSIVGESFNSYEYFVVVLACPVSSDIDATNASDIERWRQTAATS